MSPTPPHLPTNVTALVGSFLRLSEVLDAFRLCSWQPGARRKGSEDDGGEATPPPCSLVTPEAHPRLVIRFFRRVHSWVPMVHGVLRDLDARGHQFKSVCLHDPPITRMAIANVVLPLTTAQCMVGFLLDCGTTIRLNTGFTRDTVDLKFLSAYGLLPMLANLRMSIHAANANELRRCTQLRDIVISDENMIKMREPVGFLRDLPALDRLVFNQCRLSNVGLGVAALQELVFKGCLVDRMPEMHHIETGKMARVRSLEVSNCNYRMNELTDCARFDRLEKLTVTLSYVMETLPSITWPDRLIDATIAFNTQLVDVSALRDCRALRRLDISNNARLMNIAVGLSTLSQLVALNVSATAIRELPCLTGMPNLERLVAKNNNDMLAIAPGFGQYMPNLLVLDVSESSALMNVEELRGCAALRELRMDACDNLSSIKGVEWLVSLQKLSVVCHVPAEEVAGLGKLPALERLRLGDSKNGQWSTLPTFDGFPRLHKLSIKDTWLFRVDALETMAHMTELDLGDCPGLADIRPVAHLRLLSKLWLTRCTQVRDIRAITGLPELCYVDLERSGVLKKSHRANAALRVLATVPALTYVDFTPFPRAELALDKALLLQVMVMADIKMGCVAAE